MPRILTIGLEALLQEVFNETQTTDTDIKQSMAEKSFIQQLQKVREELKREREEQLYRALRRGDDVPSFSTKVIVNGNNFFGLYQTNVDDKEIELSKKISYK